MITIVVATLNEERHIEKCLRDLLAQCGVPGDFEIVVVDGGSTDRTKEIVRSFPEFNTRIRLLENPRRLQVYAWNIGARAARGEYVGLASAHTEYDERYFAECLAASTRLDAANVGGVQTAVGEGAFGAAVAWAMSSPFGVGNADFRYDASERYVDSVFGGFFRRDVLLRIGGFNESNPFDEDTDINLRLRRAGYRVALSPQIRCRYHVRTSLPRLAAQMFRYGFWRRRTQCDFGLGVPLRVLAPPALVLGLVVSAVLARYPLARTVPLAYAAFLALATARAVPELAQSALLLPGVLLTMHVAYGLGWTKGLIVHRSKSSAKSRS